MHKRMFDIGLLTAIILAIAFISSMLKPTRAQILSAPYWPTQGWRVSTPEEQGFDSAKLAIGLQDLQARDAKINSLLIVRNGYVVLDAYFDPYSESIPHKLASVTKSVTASLLGIAVDQGKLQLDQPIVSLFTNRTIAHLDSRKKKITVRHLAEMMNGMESGCLVGDEATINAMRTTSDWVQAALDRQMAQDPGTRFCYDSPGMHLPSAVLQNATGMTELEFARRNLFEPLGIEQVFWQPDPNSYTRGWGDLYLYPRDAAKIGYLWLNNGRWEDKQIVSKNWLSDMVSVHGNAGGDDYGYGIWIARDKAPNDNYFAVGGGGQYIRVYPSYKMIIVVTAQGLKDYDELNPLLHSSFMSPEKPLPANSAALATLKATMTKLAQPSRTWPISTLPNTVKAISNKTYIFNANSVAITTMRLDSRDSAKAVLHMTLEGANVVWPIGLDGQYRIASSGQGLRGYWEDSETFVFEIFEDGVSTFRLHFVEDRLEVSSPDRGLSFEGQLINP